MTTKLKNFITIQMVGVTNKKEIFRIRDNLRTKAFIEVVLHIDEDVVEGNLIRIIFSATIIRSVIIMLVIALKTK